MPNKRNIIMTVMNDVIHDGRVMKEARTMKQAGYFVTVVGIGNQEVDYQEDNIRIILAKQSALWRIILNKRKSVVEVGNNLQNKLKQSFKIKVYNFLKGHFLLCKSLSDEKKVLKIIKRKRLNIDAVHCHDLNTLFVGVGLKKKQKVSVLVYDSHELWTEMSGINPIVKRYYQKKEKQYIKYADKVITVSPSIARILQAKYQLSSMPILVRNLPERVEKTNETLVSREDNTKIKIIYVGYYLKGRGIEYVIQQIPQVDSCYEFYFRMEGNTGEMEELKKEIIKKGIEDRVTILPFVPQKELIKEIRNYDVGILPYINVSLNNKYCLPNKVFQYLESGIAVLANDLPDVAALLKENGCGLCYDMDSERSLANVLNKEMKENYEQYKINAGRVVREILNWECEREKLLGIYNGKFN